MKAFLGSAVAANSGLATYYIVARQPEDQQVTERAIPVQVFDLKKTALRDKLLRKWTKMADMGEFDLRRIVDWNYYKGRYANAVLKIVSIPAALQAMDNPVPGIEYPPWLLKRCRELQDKRKQKTVTSFLAPVSKGEKVSLHNVKPLEYTAQDTGRLDMVDIEDLPLKQWTEAKRADRRRVAVVTRRKADERAAQRMKANKRKGNLAAAGTESKESWMKLMSAPRPDKIYDFAGWVRQAKKIWRAQRSARVQRYSLKRSRGSGEFIDVDGNTVGDHDEGDEESEDDDNDRPLQRRRVDGASAPAPVNFVAETMVAAKRNKKDKAAFSFFRNSKVPSLLGKGVM